MKMSLGMALEQMKNLEERKAKVVSALIDYTLNEETVQSMVAELKDIEEKLEQYRGADVSVDFLEKK